MIYYSHKERELPRSGIQEGELAVYTGAADPRQPNDLSPDDSNKNAYVYLWQEGCPLELDTCFRRDEAGVDVLNVQAGEDGYAFLRDKSSGYIRQFSGPAKPITVANIGAFPLRIDTFLGKFTVHAGTILRLDEDAPQREKKKVLLTLTPRHERPLESAELWDGTAWQRLNICEEPSSFAEGHALTVRDGNAIVQHMVLDRGQELLMPDPPEPDPDYEVFVCGKAYSAVTLRFDRSDYRDGQVVQRTRTISFTRWGEPVAYELQKLRGSLTLEAARRCAVELSEWKAALASEQRTPPLPSGEPQALLEEDGPGVRFPTPEPPEDLPG